MERRFRAVFESLGFRLLIPLVATMGLVLAVHAVISFRSTENYFLGFVRANLEHSSELIKRATHDGMLLNNKGDVQAMIARLAQGPEIAAIRVYDKAGTIMMSAQPEEIGRRINADSEVCVSCHQPEQARDIADFGPRDQPEFDRPHPVLRRLCVIENEPRCATAACHAHPADRRVLGVLDLEISAAPLREALRTARRQLLWTTFLLVLFVGLVVAVFIRRVIYRPVFALFEGTRRVAEGDLDTRIEVRGRDELAHLAEGFNQMAAQLGAAQREITQWSEKLEEKVVQKSAELSLVQRQVLHMEKMASLGKLSATVAHELNNPISGMLTYARLVRRELAEQPLVAEVREELSRWLSLVEEECLRCGAIVQNLLTFARRTGADMEPVDVNEIVQQSLMLVQHHLEMSAIALRRQPLEGESRIVADAGQLQQAMVALLVNAVEAMKGLRDAPRELGVVLSDCGDEIAIDVSDTGVGIPPEALPQVFEPFFSTKESGVGLGLAVVYGIVQRHGGRIEVESAVGRGTVFHLRLPRRGPPPEADAAADAPVTAARDDDKSFGNS